MPDNAVYIGRPSKWGNPFIMVGDQLFSDASHRRTIFSPWIIYDQHHLYTKEEGLDKCLELYKLWVMGWLVTNDVKPCPFSLEEARKELNGKDLACWCPRTKKCHADILIELLSDLK